MGLIKNGTLYCRFGISWNFAAVFFSTYFRHCFRLVRDFDSELLQIAMASGAVADHRKKILVLSRISLFRFRIENLGLFVSCIEFGFACFLVRNWSGFRKKSRSRRCRCKVNFHRENHLLHYYDSSATFRFWVEILLLLLSILCNCDEFAHRYVDYFDGF